MRIVVLALAIMLHYAAWGQVSAVRYSIEPTDFRIGDSVTLMMEAPGIDQGSILGIAEGQEGEADYYIHSLKPREGGIEIRFSVFTIRAVRLPIIVYQGGSIELPEVQASSSFGGATIAPSPHRGPSLLPGAGTRLSFFALSVVVGAGAIFVLLVLGRRLVVLAVEAYREGLPYRCLLRRLKLLEDSPDSSSFYAGLVYALKEYFEGSCGINCAPMTSSELEDALRDRLSSEECTALGRILRTADAAKFGGLDVDPGLRGEQAAEARLIAERLSHGIEEAA